MVHPCIHAISSQSHRHRCSQRRNVRIFPWIFITQIFFQRPVIEYTHDHCIYHHGQYYPVNSKVCKEEYRCKKNNIDHQSDCCIDHRNIGFSDCLKDTIGYIGSTVQNNGNHSDDHQLSCKPFCRREDQTGNRLCQYCQSYRCRY